MVVLTLSQYCISKWHVLFAIYFSVLLCASFLLNFPEREGYVSLMVACLAVAFFIWKEKEILFSIVFTVLGLIIIMFSMQIANSITWFLFEDLSVFDREDIFLYIFICVLMYVIAFMISVPAGKLIQKVRRRISIEIKGKYAFYILSSSVMTLVLFYYLFFLSHRVNDLNHSFIIIVALCSVFLVLLFISIYMFLAGIKSSLESAHKQELLDALRGYTSDLEKMYDDMRKFRHDHINMLSPLYGYIESKEMDGLKAYFTDNIVPIGERMKYAISTIDRLKNIGNIELRGLLRSKLMHAQDRDINVNIETKGFIDSIPFPMTDLIRIFGIFIDNAIDECQGADAPYINFAAIKDGRTTTLIIVNPVKNPPPVSEIFKDGFSTKGEGRGLGLFTARQMIDKSRNAILKTSVRDNEFIQELIIAETQE